MGRLNTIIALLVVALACPGVASAQDKEAPKRSAQEDRDGLKTRMKAILGDKRLKNVQASIHMVDLDSGDDVFAKNPDKRLNPASNVKLVTAAAVLDRYGPAYTYTTQAWGGRVSGGVLQGDLTLSGNGDPFLEWSHLLEMAERIRRRGVKEVSGDLVVDDTAFDDTFLPPAYGQKKEKAPYRTSVAAVAPAFAALTVIVSPGEAGKAPRVSFDPPNDYAIIDNQATTLKKREDAARKPLTLDLIKDKDKQRTRLVLGGSVAVGGGATVRTRVDYPSVYGGYLFLTALEAVGIKVKGKVRRGPRQGGKVMARHISYTMPYLLSAMQKWSNNFMAEMLFKSLGRGDGPATWAKAQGRIETFMKKAGVEPGSYKITNGSGLYDANEISARQFTQVLRYMYGRPDVWTEYHASFSIGGVDGTLGKRMRKVGREYEVRAKTGTLNRVVTLSGYTRTKAGRKVAYSILFNKTRGGAWSFRAIQDEMIKALVESY